MFLGGRRDPEFRRADFRSGEIDRGRGRGVGQGGFGGPKGVGCARTGT